MDLNQLNTFLQVADLGSLSKAADRLHIAQPALSRQIRLLEAELRVSLFVRHGRGMKLTEPGKRLHARAAGILRQVDDARMEMAQEASIVRGHVVLGLPPTVGSLFTTRVVQRLLALYPHVTLRIVQAFSGYLLEWLQRGEIDTAVVCNYPPAASIRFSPLLIENLYLVTSEKKQIAPCEVVTFAQAAALRLVLPGPGQGIRQFIEAQAHLRGLALAVTVEADDFQILKDLVEQRIGATILPLFAVHEEVLAGRLYAVPIIDPPLMCELMLAESLTHPPSSAAQRFGVVLREEVIEMVRTGIWEGELG